VECRYYHTHGHLIHDNSIQPLQTGETTKVDGSPCSKGVFPTKFTVVPFKAVLVIKTLKELERDRRKTNNIKHNDNISLDDIIEITKVMRLRSMVKDLKGTVNEILGKCVFVGRIVASKNPKDLLQKINDGDVDVPFE
ncbi:hypothetical protein Golax_016776, partial [Gossypium laxum]|nr:hypothetical protein [Gossypium laxum]